MQEIDSHAQNLQIQPQKLLRNSILSF
jgi:hypothetical protein